MAKREIIKIDEDKCNGCGLCVVNCHEGALKVINGKARLIGESLCDGLGACIGHCPQGAITIEQREAQGYNQTKIVAEQPCACPSAKAVDFGIREPGSFGKDTGLCANSELRHWPVQIKLLPADAPYLTGADILIAADCVPFAYAQFHQDLLKGKILLVGCPKLDDLALYRQKITQILKNNKVRSVTYARMEVPCCCGLINIIQDAISQAAEKIPFTEIVISIKGARIK
jgi:ferredoxin